MKDLLLLLLTFSCYQMSQSQVPYKNPFFADDIVIHNTPDRDQRCLSFTSAPNGWEYSLYTNNIPIHRGSLTFSKSIDDGENWSMVLDYPVSWPDIYMLKTDLITTGDLLANLYLLKMEHIYYTTSASSTLYISGKDLLNFQGQQSPPLINGIIRDGAFAGDGTFAASVATPHSIALVFSRNYSPVKDSINVWISVNQGFSWTKGRGVYGTSNKYLGKVAISYGHTPSVPEGKYYITWEEKNNLNSNGGHIYYSHNTADILSTFSTPVDLNQFLPGTGNLLRNPKIAVQTSYTNNGKENLTAVVLAEKYDMNTQKSQVIGFVNDHAATDDNNWRTFVIGDTTHHSIQPDISYNMYDSTFMVVYFDSTEKKIPYLLHKFDFDENPISWNVVSTGINNSDNISNPLPQVKLCYSQHTGAVVWVSENEMGNGVGRYDAPLHYYTGVKESSGKTSVKVYPNPASDYCTIDLSTHKEIAEISLMSSNGSEIKSFRTDQTKIQIPLTDIQEGFYLIKITSSQGISLGKVVVNR